MYGVLEASPVCTLNSGGDIDVDFGNKVGIESIDGVNYRTPLDYKITCEKSQDRINNAALKLTLTATATSFDNEAIQSNINDLGIRIYANNGQGDVVMGPGTVLKISTENPPLLVAVPVKRGGAMLPTGSFDATATLTVEYQ